MRLGPDFGAGETTFALVPTGWWQAAAPLGDVVADPRAEGDTSALLPLLERDARGEDDCEAEGRGDTDTELEEDEEREADTLAEVGADLLGEPV